MLENLNVASKITVPAEFRAALTFDGQEGSATLPSLSVDQVPDFDAFLLEQGFSPELYEVVGTPRTSRWQQREGGEWLVSYRFSFKRKNPELDLPLLYATAKKGVSQKTHTPKGDKALVVMLADFQLGKFDSRGGLEEQLGRINVAFNELLNKIQKGKYQKVILAEMGDVIEGFYNKASMQQTYSNTLSQMQQVDLAITLLWDLAKRASKWSEVTFASVASNHCQFRLSGQQVGSPGQDDWGIMIAKQIARLSSETNLPIKVLVPQPSDESLALDVFGDQFHILGLWHGHQSSRPESVPSWWEKQAFGQQPVSAATIGLTGHFHHFRIQELGQSPNGGSRYWIQGKTMDNGSGWFRLNQGSDSQPGLTCFELERNKHFTGSVFHV